MINVEHKDNTVADFPGNGLKYTGIDVLAHEIRGPLHAAQLSLSLIDRNPNDVNGVIDAVQVAQRQLNRINRLVEDLFDVFRLDQGKIQVDLKLISVNGLMHQAMEDCSWMMEVRDHEFRLDLLEQDVFIGGDLHRLLQVFGNLLGNAAKFTSNHGMIWFRAERQGDRVALTVRDNGQGIKAETMPTIFDFYSQETNGQGGGMGIGLALVKRLIELQGGSVAVESDGLGCGAKFTVTFPVLEGSLPCDEHVDLSTNISTSVLVIDDDESAAKTLAKIITLNGNEAFSVHTGLDGVREAVFRKPDVVLIDISLPDIGGSEVAMRIRKVLPNANLVALTGYWKINEEHVFDHHLVKPIDLPKLFEIINGRLVA